MLLRIHWFVGFAIGMWEKVFVVCHVQMSVNVRFWDPIMILCYSKGKEIILLSMVRGENSDGRKMRPALTMR